MPHPFTEAAKAFMVSTLTWSSNITLPLTPLIAGSPAISKMFIEREYLLPFLVKIGSPRFRRWIIDHLPYKNLHEIRDIVDTWDRTTTEIFEEKKKALKEGDEALAKQIGQARDLMSILSRSLLSYVLNYEVMRILQ